MKSFRLNRLFNAKSGRCFDVAVDHGFFNQPGFLQGIESMPRVIRTLVDAAPDAIQLTVGQARHLQEIRGKQKPALVLRTDVANIYGKELPATRISTVIADAMLQAVRHDAACVCVNLFQVPGAPEVHAQCIDNIVQLKPQADYYGMPMMVEPLVFRPNSEAGGYMVDGDEVKITHLVRQAVGGRDQGRPHGRCEHLPPGGGDRRRRARASAWWRPGKRPRDPGAHRAAH
jgi:class I fructose-bisphosphate aldolase